MNALLPLVLLFCNLQAPIDGVDPAVYLRSRGVTVSVPALTAAITNPATTPAVRHAALAYLERAGWPELAVLAASVLQAEPDPVFRRALARSGRGRTVSGAPHGWASLAESLDEGFSVMIARDAASAALPDDTLAALLGGRIPLAELAAAVSFDRVLVSIDGTRVPGTMLVVASGAVSPPAFIALLQGIGPQRVFTNEYNGRIAHTVHLMGEGTALAFASPRDGVWVLVSSSGLEEAGVVLNAALQRLGSPQAGSAPLLPGAVIAMENGSLDAVIVVRFPEGSLPEGSVPGSPQELEIRLEALEDLRGTAVFTFKKEQDARLFGEAFRVWREGLSAAADPLPDPLQAWMAVWQLETRGVRVVLRWPRPDDPVALFREFLRMAVGP
jgi:hypothetical protein